MSKIDDGGQAFARPQGGLFENSAQRGMTRRQVYAMAAMQAFLRFDDLHEDEAKLAEMAFKHADALIKHEREEK